MRLQVQSIEPMLLQEKGYCSADELEISRHQVALWNILTLALAPMHSPSGTRKQLSSEKRDVWISCFLAPSAQLRVRVFA